MMMQPPLSSRITLTQYSPWVWHVSREGKHLGTISGDRVGGFTARDIHHDSIGRGFVSAEAAIQAWLPSDGQPPVVAATIPVHSDDTPAQAQ